MKCIIIKQYLYYLLLIFILRNAALAEQKKIRRNANIGGTSGLYAFPRVGRSDPAINNRLHNDPIDNRNTVIDSPYPAISMEDYEDYIKSDIKRANLVAFPRVGRTNNNIQKLEHLMALQKSLDRGVGSSSAKTGIWFGPRLGRRNMDNQNDFDQAD